MADAEKNMQTFVRSQISRQATLKKKEDKLKLIDQTIAKQNDTIQNKIQEIDDTMRKARIMTFQKAMQEKKTIERNKSNDEDGRELENMESNNEDALLAAPTEDEMIAIEPTEAPNTPEFYKKKIENAQKKIEK